MHWINKSVIESCKQQCSQECRFGQQGGRGLQGGLSGASLSLFFWRMLQELSCSIAPRGSQTTANYKQLKLQEVSLNQITVTWDELPSFYYWMHQLQEETATTECKPCVKLHVAYMYDKETFLPPLLLNPGQFANPCCKSTDKLLLSLSSHCLVYPLKLSKTLLWGLLVWDWLLQNIPNKDTQK